MKTVKLTDVEIEMIKTCLEDKKFSLRIDLIQSGDIEELREELRAKESNYSSLSQRIETIENLLLKFKRFD